MADCNITLKTSEEGTNYAECSVHNWRYSLEDPNGTADLCPAGKAQQALDSQAAAIKERGDRIAARTAELAAERAALGRDD